MHTKEKKEKLKNRKSARTVHIHISIYYLYIDV